MPTPTKTSAVDLPPFGQVLLAKVAQIVADGVDGAGRRSGFDAPARARLLEGLWRELVRAEKDSPVPPAWKQRSAAIVRAMRAVIADHTGKATDEEIDDRILACLVPFAREPELAFTADDIRAARVCPESGARVSWVKTRQDNDGPAQAAQAIFDRLQRRRDGGRAHSKKALAEHERAVRAAETDPELMSAQERRAQLDVLSFVEPTQALEDWLACFEIPMTPELAKALEQAIERRNQQSHDVLVRAMRSHEARLLGQEPPSLLAETFAEPPDSDVD